MVKIQNTILTFDVTAVLLSSVIVKYSIPLSTTLVSRFYLYLSSLLTDPNRLPSPWGVMDAQCASYSNAWPRSNG
jgi:hypothetical protein